MEPGELISALPGEAERARLAAPDLDTMVTQGER